MDGGGLKVGVVGAAGRMGSEVCRALESDDDVALVARVGRNDDLELLVETGAQVAVDFTTPAAVKDNVRFCVERGIHSVVGTTGLSESDVSDIEAWTRESDANVFIAPNFAVGAVLMMIFAERAARYFDMVEIVERHHDNKRDAPSGTALRTAALMNSSREAGWRRPRDEKESLPRVRGGDVSGVRVHSLRVPGSVAHQDVIFGSKGETLTIRHDSLDRSCFMPGVLLAVKSVGSLRGVTVGLERLLDL